MKQVGVGEAQAKLSDLLKDLPFEITKYGKVIAVVSSFSQSVPQHTGSSSYIAGNEPKHKIGWCQKHFERGVAYPLTKVEYRDENDAPVFKGDVCPSCLADFKRLEKEKGALIYE